MHINENERDNRGEKEERNERDLNETKRKETETTWKFKQRNHASCLRRREERSIEVSRVLDGSRRPGEFGEEGKEKGENRRRAK